MAKSIFRGLRSARAGLSSGRPPYTFHRLMRGACYGRRSPSPPDHPDKCRDVRLTLQKLRPVDNLHSRLGCPAQVGGSQTVMEFVNNCAAVARVVRHLADIESQLMGREKAYYSEKMSR